MTTYTPILNIPQVASNQNQKEATINTGIAILEAASNDSQIIDLTKGATTLSTDQFTKYFLSRFQNAPSALVVTIPNSDRYFCVANEGAYNITLLIAGLSVGTAGASLVIPAAAIVLVSSDGVNLRSISQGVSRLRDLSDTSNLGDASSGQVVGWNNSTQVWEPHDNPADLSFSFEAPPAANAVVCRFVAVRPSIFYAEFVQSQGLAATAPASDQQYLLYYNNNLFGGVKFAAGQTLATFTSDNGGQGVQTLALNQGDSVVIRAPGTIDQAMTGVAVTLKGVYTA